MNVFIRQPRISCILRKAQENLWRSLFFNRAYLWNSWKNMRQKMSVFSLIPALFLESLGPMIFDSFWCMLLLQTSSANAYFFAFFWVLGSFLLFGAMNQLIWHFLNTVKNTRKNRIHVFQKHVVLEGFDQNIKYFSRIVLFLWHFLFHFTFLLCSWLYLLWCFFLPWIESTHTAKRMDSTRTPYSLIL